MVTQMVLGLCHTGVELGRGPGTLSVQAGQTCVGVCAGADVDACVDVGGCPHGRTELCLAPEGQRAPGQPKTCDSIPLAEFLDWQGTWILGKHVLTSWLLLVNVVKSETH